MKGLASTNGSDCSDVHILLVISGIYIDKQIDCSQSESNSTSNSSASGSFGRHPERSFVSYDQNAKR